MDKIIFVVIVVLIAIFLLYKLNKKNNIDNFDVIDNVVNEFTDNEVLNKYENSNKEIINNEYFNATQYHGDYLDVINAFNTLSPNNKQIFNINNDFCKTTKNVDVEKVGVIVDDFIKELQEHIANNNISKENVTSWQTVLPRQKYNDGFEKVRKSLGLPEKLYNDNVVNTKIYLVEYSDIVKYETNNEVKYSTYILIGRKQSKDKIFIKVSFMYDKKLPNNIIIENINILGYISKRGTDKMYEDINNYYNFDNLDENNMLKTDNIMEELEYKYKIREKLMQEQVENMHPDDKYTHMSIDPYKYDSYKETQTIYKDIYGDKKFE
jgi:hypothetical protein